MIPVSNNDNEYTIGEAAELLGVTTRTLRHWDAIGLLSPQYRTWSDYRLYTDEDIDTALEILVYRAAGVPLKTIEEFIHGDSSPRSRKDRLLAQRTVLTEKIADLHHMVQSLDKLIEEGNTMKAKTKAELLGRDWQNLEAEAEERWGDTTKWEQSQQAQEKMKDSDWAELEAEAKDFADALADAAERHVEPGSAEAAELVDRHLASITRFYEAGREKQILLARMYVADSRFDRYYRGNAGYLLELIEAQARKEGIDPATAEWR